MHSDGWIAGVAALAALAGLTAGLALMAVRSPPPPVAERVERIEPGAGPLRAGPLLCLTAELVCAAPALPDGYPCTCQHPWRGPVAGRITSTGEADEALEDLPGRPSPILELDDLSGP
jgi:hypothetical protein